MTKVLGLDISRNFAVGFLLEHLPQYPKDWFDSFSQAEFKWKRKTYKMNEQAHFLSKDFKGLQILYDLKPDIMILEPTGYWYAALWPLRAKEIGCKIIWISHDSLKASREHFGFKNKDDDIDAFCLALTWFDPTRPKNRYMKWYDHERIEQIRQVYSERQHYTKNIVRGIAKIKLWLDLEVPEIAMREMTALNKKEVNPTLAHIAGIHHNREFPKNSIGIGIQRRSQVLAKNISEWLKEENEAENLLRVLLNYREFEPYLTVFHRFGFDLPLTVSWLLRCYPLDRFFLDGCENFDQKGRSLSLRRFQAYCGLGFFYKKSGDSSSKQKKVKKTWKGSSLHRAKTYFWLLSYPVMQSKYIPENEIQAKLKAAWTEKRVRRITQVNEATGKKETIEKVFPSLESLGKDGICRFMFILSRWLWRELINELNSLDF